MDIGIIVFLFNRVDLIFIAIKMQIIKFTKKLGVISQEFNDQLIKQEIFNVVNDKVTDFALQYGKIAIPFTYDQIKFQKKCDKKYACSGRYFNSLTQIALSTVVEKKNGFPFFNIIHSKIKLDSGIEGIRIDYRGHDDATYFIPMYAGVLVHELVHQKAGENRFSTAVAEGITEIITRRIIAYLIKGSFIRVSSEKINEFFEAYRLALINSKENLWDYRITSIVNIENKTTIAGRKSQHDYDKYVFLINDFISLIAIKVGSTHERIEDIFIKAYFTKNKNILIDLFNEAFGDYSLIALHFVMCESSYELLCESIKKLRVLFNM